MGTPRPVFVTSCTLRKRVAAVAELRASSLPTGPLSTVASCWLARLGQASAHTLAEDLYAGRGFAEALGAASASELYVVSAGLGIVHAHDAVPAYSLTVASGSADDVLRAVCGPATASDWWRAAPTRSTFHVGFDAIARLGAERLILAALPSSYLRMLADDLLSLLGRVEGRLRLFCGAPPPGLHPHVAQTVMPYDERFDGLGSPSPGTRADFAQRAMRHFARVILPDEPMAAVDAHRAAVERALVGLRPRRSVSRDAATDTEIIALIVRNWGAAEGRSGRMLRLLRDHLGVACEQRRFARLFHEAAVRDDLGAPA